MAKFNAQLCPIFFKSKPESDEELAEEQFENSRGEVVRIWERIF